MLKLAIAVVAIALSDCIVIGGIVVWIRRGALGNASPAPVDSHASAWLIVAVFMVVGERAGGVVRPAGDWLFAHWPVIVGPLTVTIGTALFAFGLVQLA